MPGIFFFLISLNWQLSHLVSARNVASIEELKASGINTVQLDVNSSNSIKAAVDRYEFSLLF